MIIGNTIGCVMKNPDTIILEDENGNEYPLVMLAEDCELTATEDDVRLGKTAALTHGVIEGKKFIPNYYTTEGFQIIPNGGEYQVSTLKTLNAYDFTKLQVIICEFNSNVTDSVSASKVSIDGNMYEVRSIETIAVATKDDSAKVIKFGIANNTGKPQILRYFTYKEI